MAKKEKQQKKKKGQSVQDMMGIQTFTKYGLLTDKGELLFYLVSPTNISVYKETQAKQIIVAQIARKRAMMMNPQENFNCDYFSDLIDYIMLSSSGEVKLHTKVGTEITEGENEPWL